MVSVRSISAIVLIKPRPVFPAQYACHCLFMNTKLFADFPLRHRPAKYPNLSDLIFCQFGVRVRGAKTSASGTGLTWVTCICDLHQAISM
jgi:hypothetical protein